MAVVAALTFLGALLLVWVQLDGPIGRVKVEGKLDDSERDQVRGVVAGALDGGLMSADLETLRAEIKALSWPRTVSIRRQWPDTLIIEVQKPTVVAVWQDAYLGSDGQIVKLPGKQDNLPIFDCRISEPRFAMQIYHRLSKQVDRAGLDIERLSENALGEWTIMFADGVTLMLGAEQADERLGRFLTVYEQRLVMRFDQVAHVDARYANGVAVSWNPPKPADALLARAR